MADDSRIELQLRALNGEDVVVPYPQSRVEKLLYKMNGYDIELDPPQSRVEVLLKEYIDKGGGDITVESLTATENKTYTAPTGKAYSPVIVNVAGGGGDFSYINVTFINSDGLNSNPYEVIYAYTDDEYGLLYDSIASIGAGEPEQIIPLLAYKGRITLSIWDNMRNLDDSIPPVVTGNIVFDDDRGEFAITGEGTITLKAQNIG